MSLHRIIGLTLQCVLLCIVNLSKGDLPQVNPETGVLNLPYLDPSQPNQAGDIECSKLRNWKNGEDDNGDAVSVPPDVCGLCPAGEHDLEPCECISMGHKLAGLMSIKCDSSTEWTTVDEIKEMINSVDEYLTTHVFRFTLTGTNVTGTLNGDIWGPLDFHQIIMDNNKIQIVDNHAFASSKKILTLLSLKNNEIIYFHWDQLQDIPHLYQLVLQGNNLSFIPSEIFPKTEIAYLDLSRNMINYIGPYAFDKLHKLRKLDLSHNELRSLDDNMFSITQHDPEYYNNLQVILSNNYISYISMDAFSEVHPVIIDLSNNLLTTVEKKVFMPLILGNNHYLSVSLTDNPIVCDCGIYWMTDVFIKGIFGNFECYDNSGEAMDVNFDDLQPSFFYNCTVPAEY